MALTNKLSAIGDAIREKTGKTELLTLDAMPAEIASIQGGGGTGEADHTVEDMIIENANSQTSLEYYKNERIKNVGNYGLYQMPARHISLPNVLTVGSSGLASSNHVYSIDLPKATALYESAFRNCTWLTKLKIPNVVSVSKDIVGGAASLKFLSLPKVTEIMSTYLVQNATSLTAVELDSLQTINQSYTTYNSLIRAWYLPKVEEITVTNAMASMGSVKAINLPSLQKITNTRVFRGANVLKAIDLGPASDLSGLEGNSIPTTVETVVLRYNGVPTLSYSGSDIFRSGSIYVPRAQVDAYKSATNWSTVAGRIKAIEDYPAETNYIGVIDDNSEIIGVDSPYTNKSNITGIRTNAISVHSNGSYESGGFVGCSALAYANLPEATTVGGFANCPDLKWVEAPKVETIQAYGFYNTPSLSELDLPATLKKVERYAFAKLASGARIILRSPTVVTANAAVFADGYYDAELYVPAALVQEYKNHPYWGGEFRVINAIEGSRYEEVVL